MRNPGQTAFQRQLMIFVRNNGTEPFTDRYDGEDFTIEPGGYIDMPPEAAKLCLGLGDEDKHRVIRRLGWAATEKDMKTALERLDQFSFHSTEDEAQAYNFKKNRSSAPAVADKPASQPEESERGAGEGSGEAEARDASRQPNNLLAKVARVQQSTPA